MRGGEGFPNGGSFASSVYGDPQTSVGSTIGGSDNTISMQPAGQCAGSTPSASVMPVGSVMTGGGCGLMPQQTQMGGNMVDTVAVPAVLMAANQLYKRRSLPLPNMTMSMQRMGSMPFSGRRTRRFRRRGRSSRRFRSRR
jgi:hypothetical protein